jgi:hypothetical protein
MAAFMPVSAGTESGTVPRDGCLVWFRSADEALAAVARHADLLIAWGVARLDRLAAGLELPIVYVSHGPGDWTAKRARSSEARADGLVAVSEATLTGFSAAARRRAVVIHNGIDVQRCAPTLSRPEVRARWGVGERERLIGYAGRYSFEKNTTAAAYATHRLAGEYHAVFAGDGWQEQELRPAGAALPATAPASSPATTASATSSARSTSSSSPAPPKASRWRSPKPGTAASPSPPPASGPSPNWSAATAHWSPPSPSTRRPTTWPARWKSP